MKDKRINYIEMVRVEDGKAHVLGRMKDHYSGKYTYIIHDIDSGKILSQNKFSPYSIFPTDEKSMKDYRDKIKLFEKKNLADLEKKVKNIKLYQGTIKEVSKILRRKLELVDTGEPQTYIDQENDILLRSAAKKLGADLLVYCSYYGGTGTPMKFVDEGDGK